MSCTACQYALNLLLALDKGLNTLLGGDPSETLSRRLGRAEDAGSTLAGYACWVLGVFSKNHCTWSEQPGTEGKEVWSWSKNFTYPVLTPNNPPVAVVAEP